jgi:ABC-type branched-subunit amino acid transport system substrate-binding protein
MRAAAAARVAVLVAATATTLAACGSTPRPYPTVGPSDATLPRSAGPKPGLTPSFAVGQDLTRIGLLLPFSQRAQDAEAFYNAAELALFERGQDTTLLIPRDAGATAGDAETAARDLVREGADIILGPLLRDQVVGAGRAARNADLAVIGFSTDVAVAGGGVYLLSFPLEEEVIRIVDYAVSRGLRTFALLAPAGEYGTRVETVMRRRLAERQATLAVTRTYARGDREAGDAASALAASAGSLGVQAVLIADGGATLRTIGPALVSGGLNLGQVRLLGTGAWAGTEASREPTLAGGWFAAPDPAGRRAFESKYQETYRAAPPRLASLAYDGVSLATFMSRDQGRTGISRSALERADGFLGADGVFRFRRDGTVERALAVLEVRPGGPVVIDAAPRRFDAPAS